MNQERRKMLDKATALLEEAARAIASLRARVSELERERDEAGEVYAKSLVIAQQINGNTIIELRRQRDELREALRPFAAEADKYDPVENDDHTEAWNSDFTCLDLRRARAALANTGGE